MQAKLIPHLRLLTTSLSPHPLPAMKPGPTLKPSRAIPIFSRIFPHKLKYRSFGTLNLPSQPLKTQFSTRRFSARSAARARPSPGTEARASVSLVEDEAELSDWVSGLGSNSFRKTKVYSDSEDDGGGGRGRNSFGREMRDGGARGRGRGRGERGGKRRRESDFSDSDGLNGTEMRDSRQSFSRRGGDSGRANEFSRRRGDSGRSNEFSRGRGDSGRSNEFSIRRGDSGRSNEFSRRRGDSGRSNEFSIRRGDSGRSNEFSRRSGTRDSMGSSSGRRGNYGGDMQRENGLRRKNGGNERGSETGYGRDRVDVWERGSKEREKVPRRGGLLLSDEDDVDKEENENRKMEKGYTRFAELIDSEEDSEELNDDDDEEEEEEEEEENGDDLLDKGSDLSLLSKEDGLGSTPPSSVGESDSYLSNTRFDQCSISSLSMKGIKDAGYERMTVVQEATLPVILRGKDVMAKAKTGTGKTVAFLLPAIEAVAKSTPIARDQKRPPILVLVICPTRELATQAAAEAKKLLKYHSSIGVQVVIGGTRLAVEQKNMQANPCQILVATPGRLRDHSENTAGFATRLMGVKVLVLDEADHLLDMGFRKDIEKIIASVPKQRQTLLFSATIPQEVRQICHIALNRDHEFINTVQEGEETHTQVKQMHLVAPLDKHFSLLYALLKEHIADDVNYKVLVFCTTAMVTRLVADLLGELNLNVREIHSRKPQSYRTRVSEEFRKSKGLILVTSDVSARGVDYPDVTFVIQIGLPADRQQYIHRLGRTGRKGKEGRGILLLAPWEEFFLSTVKDLPISKSPEPLVDPETKKKVERALSHVEMKNKEAAYQAWLGYYNSNKTVARDKYKLVELANEFSRCMGLDNPPAISKLVLGKMGLKNIPGLRSK